MKSKTINLSDIANHPNLSLSAKDYLYDYRETISIAPDINADIQRLLDLGENIDIKKEKIGKDEVLHTITARFKNGIEADIKVCSSESGCYIDPVLFNNDGHQICVLDVESDLIGDYMFEYNNKSYLVEIVLKDEQASGIDYHLESKLANMSLKFQELEEELLNIEDGAVWNDILENFSGNPLENLDEYICFRKK